MDEQLPRDHRARWIDQIVDELDLSDLHDLYAGVGSEAHPPSLMLKGVLLENLENRRSPAQWARDFRESRPLLWLTRGIQPSRTALYNFRDRCGRAIESLNAQLIRRARQEGFLEGEVDVQDGTVIRACASRHRLLNRETLVRRLEILEQCAQSETSLEQPPGWLARTSRGRERQVRRYRQAAEVLEQRLAHNACKQRAKRLAENHVLVSASDPEAALGRDKQKVFGPCYTSQFSVERGSLLVTAWHVAAQATDAGTLPLMLDQRRDVLGEYARKHVADSAYVSILDLQECARRNVQLIAPFQENDLTARKRAQQPSKYLDKKSFTWLEGEQTYACPQGHRLKLRGRQQITRRGGQTLFENQYRCPAEHCRACPVRAQCCRNPQTGRTIKRIDGEELLQEHLHQMATPEAAQLRRQRGSIIERAFADTKHHRGLDRFHGRGLHRARAEVGLAVLAINLLRLHNLRKTRLNSNNNSS